MSERSTATLLINAPDRKGLVHAISSFLLQHNGNILHADQHQDAGRTIVPDAHRMGFGRFRAGRPLRH